MEKNHFTHLDIALRVAGFNFGKETLDLVYRIIKAVDVKGGETNLLDIIKIQADVDKEYKEIKDKL